jgi:hypothetical protein
MEDINKKIAKPDQLLQARQEQLDNKVLGTLRTHGKLWSVDVFSWYKPDVYELENTLSSFPAPIYWFNTQKEIDAILKEDTTWISNVKVLCVLDNENFQLSEVERTFGVNSIENALEVLEILATKKGILLFTCSTENWFEIKTKFENFILKTKNK